MASGCMDCRFFKKRNIVISENDLITTYYCEKRKRELFDFTKCWKFIGYSKKLKERKNK